MKEAKRCSHAIVAAAAIIAGIAWIAKDLGSRIAPDYWNCNSASDYACNGVDTIAFLVLGFTMFGLRRLFANAIEQKRAWVGVMSGICLGVAGIANLLEHCAGLDELGFAYVIGLMLGMLLLLLFSLVLRRAPIPIWCAGLLLLGTAAGTLLANQGGFIVFGCAWMLLGLVLIRRPPKDYMTHFRIERPLTLLVGTGIRTGPSLRRRLWRAKTLALAPSGLPATPGGSLVKPSTSECC